MIPSLPIFRELQLSLNPKTPLRRSGHGPHQPVLLIVANREKQLSLDR